MAEPPKRRHLPVLPSQGDDEEPPPEARGPGEWVAICAGVTFVAWLLAAGVGNMAAQRLAPESVPLAVGLNVAALALACGGAGYLVGRRGPRAEARHARAGAALTAALGWAIAFFQSGAGPGPASWGLALAALLALALLGASVGFRLGRRRR